MKLLSFLSNLNKKKPKKIIHHLRLAPIKPELNRDHNIDQEQREALIQIGRLQFKKLEELGLKIPIAVL